MEVKYSIRLERHREFKQRLSYVSVSPFSVGWTILQHKLHRFVKITSCRPLLFHPHLQELYQLYETFFSIKKTSCQAVRSMIVTRIFRFYFIFTLKVRLEALSDFQFFINPFFLILHRTIHIIMVFFQYCLTNAEIPEFLYNTWKC